MGLKALAKQSSHYLAAQIGVMLLGFVSFPIFTRVFSVADYGTLDLVQRLALLGVALGKLGMQNAVLRFYKVKGEGADQAGLRQHISTSLVGTGGSGIIAALVVTALFFYFKPAGGSHGAMLALAAGGLVVIRIIQAIMLSILRIEERSILYSLSYVGSRALTVATILALFTLAGENLQSYFIGTIAVEGLVIAAFAVWLMRRGVLSLSGVEWGVFRQMVAFGLPLIAFEALSILMDSGDRVLISYFLGAGALGYYTGAFALSLYLHDLMMVPLNLALTPMYLKIWGAEGAEATSSFLSQSLRMYIMIACGVLAGVIACAHDAVFLLASKKYETSVALVPWMAAGMLLYASNFLFNAGLIIHKKTTAMVRFALIVVVFKLISNSILLPRIGLNGAVVSSVVAYGLFVFLTARASLPLLPLKVDWGTLIRGMAALGAAAFSASLIHFDWLLLSLLARGTCAVAVYAACLMTMDREARSYGQEVWRRLRGTRQMPGFAMLALGTLVLAGQFAPRIGV